MELGASDSSICNCRKHLAANHHPNGRPMQEKTSLLWFLPILTLILASRLVLPAAAQTSISSFPASAAPTAQNGASAIPAQSPFFGGTSSGKATDQPIALTLREAIDRGLRYNLGLVLSGISSRSARAQRLRSLSELLPHVAARVGETDQKINLAAFGFPVPAGTNPIIGPFNVFDARGTLTEALDLHFWKNYRAASEEVHA